MPQQIEAVLRAKVDGNSILVFGILLGSPLAFAKAAGALPVVHTKHDILQNINKQ
jgi:hypothetical protein